MSSNLNFTIQQYNVKMEENVIWTHVNQWSCNSCLLGIAKINFALLHVSPISSIDIFSSCVSGDYVFLNVHLSKTKYNFLWTKW